MQLPLCDPRLLAMSYINKYDSFITVTDFQNKKRKWKAEYKKEKRSWKWRAYLIHANHGVAHEGKPIALSKALPFILADAFIQPLKGKAEVMRKASQIVFNVWDPSLWVGIWIDANEFIREFNTPCISNQPIFLNSELIVVFISSLLPLPLLTLFNRLFSPIYMGGRLRQVLRRTIWSSTSPSSLVSSNGRACNIRGRKSSSRRMRSEYRLSCLKRSEVFNNVRDHGKSVMESHGGVGFWRKIKDYATWRIQSTGSPGSVDCSTKNLSLRPQIAASRHQLSQV